MAATDTTRHPSHRERDHDRLHPVLRRRPYIPILLGAITLATLGALFHYSIAACMVLAYYVASSKWTLLLRRPVTMGLVYGVFLYGFMNLVLLPLSAAGMPSFADHSWVGWSVFMHAVFGVICALTVYGAEGMGRESRAIS